MTHLKQQELVRSARKRLDEQRRLPNAEVIQGRVTQRLTDRFAAVERAVSELMHLKQGRKTENSHEQPS